MRFKFRQATSRTVFTGAEPASLSAVAGLSEDAHKVVVLEKDHLIPEESRDWLNTGVTVGVGGSRFFRKTARFQGLPEKPPQKGVDYFKTYIFAYSVEELPSTTR